MSTLADAKARFLRGHGDPLTILRQSGNVLTIGRILPPKQRTTHALNFVRSVVLLSESGAITGDLVRLETTQELFLFDALQPKTRGGSVISWSGELLKINCASLEVQRHRRVGDGKGNILENVWDTISRPPAHVQHVSGNETYHGQLLLQTTELVASIQAAEGIRLQDRLLIEGKAYKVDDINKELKPGLQVTQLSSDRRP